MKQLTLLFLLFLSVSSLTQNPLQQKNCYEWESSLQVFRITPSPHSYARFPAPTDPDEKRELRIIEIVSVSLVVLLILYLLFRKRNKLNE